MTATNSVSTQGFDNPLWPGPRMLVPTALECLLIGQPNQSGTWADLTIDYRKLAEAFDPESKAFEPSAAPPETGAHLQITLPYSFRNGTQLPDGSVQFPAIPNRWLFVRALTSAPGTAPVLTVTVLQSDFVDDTDGSNSYPDPTTVGKSVWIGKSFDLAKWTDPAGPSEPLLLAMGPGSVSWVSTYQNTRDVLCFHDPLTGIDAGQISYAAVGWYSDAGFDPVLGVTPSEPTGFATQEEWQDIQTALRFGLGGAVGLEAAQTDWQAWQKDHPITNPKAIPAIQYQLASQSLCHGMVYGIDWKGPQAAYPRDPILDGQNPVTIAIGGTGYEGIAAWLAAELKQPTLENLLLAVQQDLAFDYIQEPSIFEERAFGARFPKIDGGTRWVVAPPSDSDADRGKSLQTVNLSEDQTTALTALNEAQTALDATLATVAGYSEELFALVFKLVRTPSSPFDDKKTQERRKQIEDAITSVSATLATLKTRQAKNEGDMGAAKTALTEALGTAFVLSSTGAPRFRAPATPSLMIAGAKQDTRFLAPGQDGSPDDLLLCRFTGQTITGLTVVVPGATIETITADDLAGAVSLPRAPAGIPKELDDFLIEMLFFDTANAELLAKIAFAKAGISSPTPAQLTALTQTIAAQQAAPGAATPLTDFDEQIVGASVGFQGVVPMKRAIMGWSPPWSPLFIDWQVTWHPSAQQADGMLQDWNLAGIQYDWTGTAIASQSETITGRTVLGTQIAAGLAGKLKDFTESDPNFKKLPISQQTALQNAYREIEDFDVITGTIAALGPTMLQRVSQMTQLTYPADPALDSYLRQAPSMVPLPGNGQAPGFYPLRAGHFTLDQVWIVDAFGQILRVTNPGETVLPIRSQSVTTRDAGGNDNARYIQIAPAMQQPSRLQLTLLDADNDAIRTNSSNLTNPVVGWLLPNHLDNSVLVFDQSGTPLGELLPVITDAGASIRWDPTPGSNVPLGAPPAIANAHLLGFVTALLAQADTSGDAALHDLLDVIDVTMWATAGTQQPADDNLAVLIGQPVAVVRAEINLEQSGPAAVNQSWAETGKDNTGGLPDIAFRTFIGDIHYTGNGALGYFLNDDYSLLNPLRGFSASMGGVRRAVRAPRGSAASQLSQTLNDLPGLVALNAPSASGYLNADPSVPLKPGGAVAKLTVLMDPRGVIPVMSGVLPVQTAALPAASVAAMNQLLATFRIGPILTDPAQVQMPLPANVAGNWSWIARTGITTWETVKNLQPSQPGMVVPNRVPTLREGWLGLVPKRPVGGDKDAPLAEMTFIEREDE
ncbi:hypothetical protein [Roseovarius sp. M141]|uniref:hypothetical protein n=1 Tax=Roseovarius sp. M141 TaxID=2583806 RepID=UPI0020CF9690|nr:hypothetical protein [Roseovarius sp. M141]MCQ0090818.1 hypothetical protein [Roseovarius sp. M141]